MQDQLISVVWDEYGIGHATLHVPMLGREIDFEFFSSGNANTVSDTMKQAVADVLALTPADVPRLADLLWEEAVFACTVADYGAEQQEGETHLDAHLRYFELATPQDAYAAATVRAVQISADHDAFGSTYAEIKMTTGTDNYVSVIVKDGEMVDFDDDGCWVGAFEKDPHNARTCRAKVLSPQQG